MQATVDLGDGSTRPLQGPAHPYSDRRRRGRIAQADDEGAAAAGVVGKRARGGLVDDTRRRAEQSDETLAHGVAAGWSDASGSPADFCKADVSLAQDFVRVHGVGDCSEGGSSPWAESPIRRNERQSMG